MAPKLSEDEIDDLIYLSRAGEEGELGQLLKELSAREQTGVAEVLEAAQDESGATCLHMAAANGHSSEFFPFPLGVCRGATERGDCGRTHARRKGRGAMPG